MSTIEGHRILKAKTAKKQLITLAVSAPIIFWLVSLFS